MTAADIQIGKTFYFGHRQVPNTVTRVIPMEANNQYVARVYLKGPRGGEFVAHVRENGTCRKM